MIVTNKKSKITKLRSVEHFTVKRSQKLIDKLLLQTV